MPIYYKIADTTLKDIANAIREKGVDVPDSLACGAFAEAIRKIKTADQKEEKENNENE